MIRTFEEKENESLNNLNDCYINVLRFQSITDLQHTAINTYNDYDATAISADTKLLIIEYKRRNISIDTYPDSIIEFEKFRKLKKYWLTGNYPIYLVEYNDDVAVFDLSHIYAIQKHLPDNYLFGWHKLAGNSVNYQKGEILKQIRYLQYHESCVIIEKSSGKLNKV